MLLSDSTIISSRFLFELPANASAYCGEIGGWVVVRIFSASASSASESLVLSGISSNR